MEITYDLLHALPKTPGARLLPGGEGAHHLLGTLSRNALPGFPWIRAPLYGGWEDEAQAMMQMSLPFGSVGYDVGANYGIHTLLMARLVGPTGQVYAFEPVPAIAAALRENIDLNHLPGIAIVPKALSDTIATEYFYRAHHDGAGHLESAGLQAGERIDVETTTMDDFVIRAGHRPPTLIKMDIEGGEGRALTGTRSVLEKFRPLLLVDLHTPVQDKMVGQILLNARYQAVRTSDGVIPDLHKPWPAKDGIWGQVFAWPEEKPAPRRRHRSVFR